MGMLQRFENRLEQLVSGAFAKAFRSAVQPVEVAAALQREVDNSAQILSRNRRLVPNQFHVELSPQDHERLAPYSSTLADELVDSDLPDDPYLQHDLMAYFPTPMKEGFRDRIGDHPLRREIIVTQVVNDLVNGAGMTFWPRLSGETGASAAELTRANFVAREIFGSLELRDELRSLDNRLDASVQTGTWCRYQPGRPTGWIVDGSTG